MTAPAAVLEGRAAIVTGASEGLGLAIAEAYVAAGASVMICARSGLMLERAVQSLAERTAKPDSVAAQCADVSQPHDVAALVGSTVERFGRLDVLVNNAAITGPIGTLESVDWDEWVRTVQINLFGSVLLARAVLPHFKRIGRGKIVQLSGGGATNPLPMLSAYASSKAAAVRLAETLAHETRSFGIDVNCLAPGALDTRMLDQFIAAGPQRIGVEFHARALQLKREGGASLTRAAALAVFLGSTRSDGITGKLLSAVWDPWEALPQYLAELRNSDVYTLRRVEPASFDLPWGTRT